MRDDSSTWIDVKFKIEGALLLHLELRGYRSDRGATVQVNYVNDALVMGLEEVLFIPSCTVTPRRSSKAGRCARSRSRWVASFTLAVKEAKWSLWIFRSATSK